jgi:hypothetical protein
MPIIVYDCVRNIFADTTITCHTVTLLPYALKLAVDVHNATLGPTDFFPDEIFSGIKTSRCHLKDFHPFGCPIFELQASIQNGSKNQKWKPCSRMAIYLGHSPEHATTIPIILNTVTGLISPQYHVVFDDFFTMTKSVLTDQIPENWPELFKHSEMHVLDDDEAFSHQLDSSWADPTLEPGPACSRSTIRLVHELRNEQEQIASASKDSSTAEPSIAPSLPPKALQRRGNLLNPAGPLARSTWNKDHRYPTKFRQMMTANIAALESTF